MTEMMQDDDRGVGKFGLVRDRNKMVIYEKKYFMRGFYGWNILQKFFKDRSFFSKKLLLL